MKNILMIIPNMTMGGAQRSFSKLSQELSRHYTVTNVIFNSFDHKLEYPLGGETIDLNVHGGNSILGKIIKFFIRLKKIKAIKKKLKIDITISFLEGADFLNILSTSSDKKIISIRGSKVSDETITGLIGKIRKHLLIPILYKKANLIVCVNKGIVTELNDYFGLKAINKKVVYNFYDIETIQKLGDEELPKQFQELLNKPYLVFCGRLAIEKGIKHLIFAFSKIKNIQKYRFVIIGDGPMMLELIDVCKKLNLSYYSPMDKCNNLNESQIIFTGKQSNPYKFVSRASLFVMASSSEGFPNSLAEAMCLKVPVASTDCPWGPRELLSKETNLPISLSNSIFADYGLLLQMPSQTNIKNKSLYLDWSNKFSEILENEALQEKMIGNGINRINDFSKNKIISEWIKLINSL